MDEKHRRLLREHRERRMQRKQSAPQAAYVDAPVAHEHRAKQRGYNRIYHDHYKWLLIFTVALIIASICVIGVTYHKTGDVIYKDVTLSGGITITVGTQGLPPVDIKAMEHTLAAAFPGSDIQIREITDFGTQQGFTIEATSPEMTQESLDRTGRAILQTLQIPEDRASMEITGSTLGASFFQQTIKAVLIAFTFMGLVVFIYFGENTWQKVLTAAITSLEAVLIWTASGPWSSILAAMVGASLIYLYIRYSIPSTAVILAALSTILFTIAVLDVMKMRISTAGIAAFLMLIGYSVDTDILLSTRVLKSKSGTVYERIVSTMKTGLTMTGTTFVAAGISLIFAQSDVIREIMLIICVGIIADVFFTWVQNAGILRMYLEHKGRKSDDA